MSSSEYDSAPKAAWSWGAAAAARGGSEGSLLVAEGAVALDVEENEVEEGIWELVGEGMAEDEDEV